MKNIFKFNRVFSVLLLSSMFIATNVSAIRFISDGYCGVIDTAPVAAPAVVAAPAAPAVVAAPEASRTTRAWEATKSGVATGWTATKSGVATAGTALYNGAAATAAVTKDVVMHPVASAQALGKLCNENRKTTAAVVAGVALVSYGIYKYKQSRNALTNPTLPSHFANLAKMYKANEQDKTPLLAIQKGLGDGSKTTNAVIVALARELLTPAEISFSDLAANKAAVLAKVAQLINPTSVAPKLTPAQIAQAKRVAAKAARTAQAAAAKAARSGETPVVAPAATPAPSFLSKAGSTVYSYTLGMIPGLRK